MLKVSLKLTRNEVGVLYTHATACYVDHEDVSYRAQQQLSDLLLTEQYERIRRQWATWSLRPVDREYSYRMPVPVAIALHLILQLSNALPASDTLLIKLDQALVNGNYARQTVQYQ